MATVDEMQAILHKIYTGIEKEVIDTMEEHTDVMVNCVYEQMYSGVDGKGKYLSPTYESDTYFDQPGIWQGKQKQYEQWKATITPPRSGTLLGLPARPLSVPNLFINGKFYSDIFAYRDNLQINIDVDETGDGPAIVDKYGESIFKLGKEAVGYFNERYTSPAIVKFYEECGL